MVSKLILGLSLGILLAFSGGAAAVTAAGKAHQGLECEDPGGSAPGGGQSSKSTGSPFHDGTGGQNYSDNSQYDVACFRGSDNRPHH